MIGAHGLDVVVDGRLLLGDLLLGDEAVAQQRLVAAQVGRIAREVLLGLAYRRLRRLQRVDALVDRERPVVHVVRRRRTIAVGLSEIRCQCCLEIGGIELREHLAAVNDVSLLDVHPVGGFGQGRLDRDVLVRGDDAGQSFARVDLALGGDGRVHDGGLRDGSWMRASAGTERHHEDADGTRMRGATMGANDPGQHGIDECSGPCRPRSLTVSWNRVSDVPGNT